MRAFIRRKLCPIIGCFPIDVHRKVPGVLGGLYKADNMEVLCKSCHMLAEQNV